MPSSGSNRSPFTRLQTVGWCRFYFLALSLIVSESSFAQNHTGNEGYSYRYNDSIQRARAGNLNGVWFTPADGGNYVVISHDTILGFSWVSFHKDGGNCYWLTFENKHDEASHDFTYQIPKTFTFLCHGGGELDVSNGTRYFNYVFSVNKNHDVISQDDFRGYSDFYYRIDTTVVWRGITITSHADRNRKKIERAIRLALKEREEQQVENRRKAHQDDEKREEEAHEYTQRFLQQLQNRDQPVRGNQTESKYSTFIKRKNGTWERFECVTGHFFKYDRRTDMVTECDETGAVVFTNPTPVQINPMDRNGPQLQ